MRHARLFVSSLLLLAGTAFTLVQLFDWDMQPPKTLSSLIWLPLVASQNSTVDLGWYAPNQTWVNNLSGILRGNGTHDFYFGGSTLPPGTKYGTYNWCNMPHVRREEYPMPREGYTLEYVEVVSTHDHLDPLGSKLIEHTRSIGITNGRLIHRILSPRNPTAGNAQMRASSTTANL